MVSRFAAAGLTTMLFENAESNPLVVSLTVIVSATLYERFVNVTTPLTAVLTVVPCSAAVPVLRAAVTDVLLSLERRLPN